MDFYLKYIQFLIKRVIYNLYIKEKENTMERKYTTIMIKKDLKLLMDKKIIDIGMDINYSELIKILLLNYGK